MAEKYQTCVKKSTKKFEVLLGEQGAILGGMLKDGELHTSDVGQWIRDHICNP